MDRLVRFVATYLVEVDGGLPELLLGLVEVTHTDLTEVTRMVLVDVGTVVVLTTGHTATTGGLAVLANSTVTGGHMAAAVKEKAEISILVGIMCEVSEVLDVERRAWSDMQKRRRYRKRCAYHEHNSRRWKGSTHCFRVFDKRVGILSSGVLATRPV
jgi:hypothetical protein